MKKKTKSIVFFAVFSLLVLGFQKTTNTLLTPTLAQNYENSFHLSQIEIYDAWTITNGTRDITIAVMDSGIDFSHPDLENVSWINTNEILNNSIDDDGNGYVDDKNGWDFVSDDKIPGPQNNDDIHWHGTAVAGIIAAHRNGVGGSGVALNITLMDIRILSYYDTITSYSGFGDGIRYAVDNGADVISTSIQYMINSTLYYDDVVYAYEKNVPIVSITGNTLLPLGGQNIPSFPGALEEVISVGATAHAKSRADYSNYGEWTEIVAPVGNEGTGLYTTILYGNYGYYYGTSFAAPQVAGVIALMRSLNHSLTVEEIRDILHKSATDIGDPGYDIEHGYGLLNASKAVRAVLDPSILIEETDNIDIDFIPLSGASMILISLAIIFKRRRRAKT
ncbi:MAG: S8 family serine peptidase [Candidatus Heimdallarchaeota archaeon]|nr:S8 family serine peptidase [Candidatus Heimdallarchaeota archaeon]MCK4878879.1 S8 family serine peptidase [Candidatus Heimdallarchaeota archaeon]